MAARNIKVSLSVDEVKQIIKNSPQMEETLKPLLPGEYKSEDIEAIKDIISDHCKCHDEDVAAFLDILKEDGLLNDNAYS